MTPRPRRNHSFRRTVAAKRLNSNFCERQRYGLTRAVDVTVFISHRQGYGVVAGAGVVVRGVLSRATTTITEIPIVFIASCPARALVRKRNAFAQRTFRDIKVKVGNKRRLNSFISCRLVTSCAHHRRNTGGQHHHDQHDHGY